MYILTEFHPIHPAFVETFPRCINLSVMSEEKSGDHQSQSCVSTKSNGNPSDACRGILTNLTKQLFFISAELKDLLLIHRWKTEWMHVQTHIWKLNLSKKWTILLWQIHEITLLEIGTNWCPVWKLNWKKLQWQSIVLWVITGNQRLSDARSKHGARA